MRSTLTELWSRLISESKDSNKTLYNNGEDNDYPNRIERIIDNSPTAKMAARKMAQFITGQGFSVEKFKINSVKGLTSYDILRMAAKSKKDIP